jgi:hypothetical protein
VTPAVTRAAARSCFVQGVVHSEHFRVVTPTSQRLLFISTTQIISIEISAIIAAQADGNWIQLHLEKRQRPVIVECPSAQLAALLIAFFLRHPFAENVLPSNMTIRAAPMPHSDGITLTFKDDTDPQRPAAPYLVSDAND